MLSRFIRDFIFSIFLFILIIHKAYADNKLLTLDLQNANLADAIQMVARFLHLNVIISPSVSGVATLHLREAAPKHAFDLLLASHGLAKWEIGNVWFIAPRDELIKRKQEELKWQEISDDASPLFARTWEIKYGNAQEILHLFQDDNASFLSKRGRIRVDARTNIVYIQDTAERIERAHRFIKQIDLPSKQILIEVRLASVDNDFERELGVDFNVKAQTTESEIEESGKMTTQEAGRYSMAVAKLADGSLLDIKLAALENAGHAELISSPSLFTTNQQPASIEAGEEIPYQEVSDSGGTAVAFKKAVLGLKVTPQILPDNKVLLQLQINQDRPSRRMVLGVPAISTRQLVTTVLARAGQTIVLGGIYESNQEEGQRRLPFISQIPVIGLLFKQQNIRENKRELLVFVTPKMITS